MALTPSPRSQLTDVFSIYKQELCGWESKNSQLPEQSHEDSQDLRGRRDVEGEERLRRT